MFLAVWTGKPLFAYIVLIHNLLLYILTLRGTVWVTLSTLESILEPSRFF